ncbi:TPA: hypothetical protein ACH3X1_013161 [Trebouxia sp. C0004]
MILVMMSLGCSHACLCRKAKPVRDIEAILKKEEDLQRIEELANAEAVAEAAAHDIEKDACDTRAAPSMELCSTEEMMSVFGEFYEGDKKDMARSHINSTCIEASVDVTAEEFDLEFAGSVAEVSMPDLDYGNDDRGWDVADLPKWHEHSCFRCLFSFMMLSEQTKHWNFF